MAEQYVIFMKVLMVGHNKDSTGNVNVTGTPFPPFQTPHCHHVRAVCHCGTLDSPAALHPPLISLRDTHSCLERDERALKAYFSAAIHIPYLQRLFKIL